MTFILHQKAAESFRRSRTEFRAASDEVAQHKVAADCLVMLRTYDPNLSVWDVLSLFDDQPGLGDD